MVQCSDLLGDQKLLHAKGCVSGWIVMVQNPGSCCPLDPLLFASFIHKASQDFF